MFAFTVRSILGKYPTKVGINPLTAEILIKIDYVGAYWLLAPLQCSGTILLVLGSSRRELTRRQLKD